MWVCTLSIFLSACQKKEDDMHSQKAKHRIPLKEKIKLETRNPVLLKLFPENSLSEADRQALLSLMKWSDLFELLDYPENVKLVAIQYNKEITDSDLQFLAGFPNVEELYLKNSSNITDVGMSVLKYLPRLKTLSVYGTKVTEASLPLIVELKDLEELHLGFRPPRIQANKYFIESTEENQLIHFTDNSLRILKDSKVKNLSINPTSISDRGLKYITEMQDLENISIVSDRITREGIEQWLPFLPKNLIHVSITIPPPLPDHIEPEIIKTDKATLVLLGIGQ